MMIVRRLLFLPVSAIVAITVGFTWASVFSHATYSAHHVLYSIVGLAPLFFGRVFPVAVFVILGTVIAPRPGKVTIALLGILGGIFGWPFGPVYEISMAGPVFYLTEGIGAVIGAGVGMVIGFTVARRKERPNQSPEPTAMSVTPPAAQESRQP
jgi:hypothetical protein